MTDKTVRAYDRVQFEFPIESGVTYAEFDGGGKKETRPTFIHRAYSFSYERHGYENVFPRGREVLAVRFTPDVPGQYTYRAMKGNETVETDSFTVLPAEKGAGFVTVSKRDPRWFELDDGTSFVPVGLNMIRPDRFEAASGVEFGRIDGFDTMGAAQYCAWMKRFSENGGNYTRLWLDDPYFSVDKEEIDEYDPAGFARVDRVLDIARGYGIRVKMTFEHFRAFDIEHTNLPLFVKTRKKGDRKCLTADEWLTDGLWQDAWYRKIDQYLARYGNDPAVFSFELWNEQNAMSAKFENVVAFTQRALTYIRERAPKNLAVNSLGSYDREDFLKKLELFKMDEMDYQQVHRYLDQGGEMEEVHKDPIEFTGSALRAARRSDKPVILAETGAVNDCHSGPFRFYSWDHEGVIMADETYAPFFYGSAGTGQLWHWSIYVDANDLWKYYKPFADMIRNEDVAGQGLVSREEIDENAWILLLEGRDTVYGYIRNKSFTWYNTLRDGNDPTACSAAVKLPFEGTLTVLSPWEKEKGTLALNGDTLKAADFTRGFLFKLKKNG